MERSLCIVVLSLITVMRVTLMVQQRDFKGRTTGGEQEVSAVAARATWVGPPAPPSAANRPEEGVSAHPGLPFSPKTGLPRALWEITRVKCFAQRQGGWHCYPVLAPPCPCFPPPVSLHPFPLHPWGICQKKGVLRQAGVCVSSPGEARTDGRPGPGKEASLPSKAGCSMHSAPALGLDDRWPPKERSPSWEQLCVWWRPAGWSASSVPAQPKSGVWGPGPRQQQDFILVTKDGKVRVINYRPAGQPASPSGQPAGLRPLQGQRVPPPLSTGGRSGGGGSEAQWGGGGERKGVSGPGFRARLAK